jgi:hypothetical protein
VKINVFLGCPTERKPEDVIDFYFTEIAQQRTRKRLPDLSKNERQAIFGELNIIAQDFNAALSGTPDKANQQLRKAILALSRKIPRTPEHARKIARMVASRDEAIRRYGMKPSEYQTLAHSIANAIFKCSPAIDKKATYLRAHARREFVVELADVWRCWTGSDPGFSKHAPPPNKRSHRPPIGGPFVRFVNDIGRQVTPRQSFTLNHVRKIVKFCYPPTVPYLF